MPLLQECVATISQQIEEPSAERLAQLQQEVRELRIAAGEASDAISSAQAFARESEGFTVEIRQQERRLESIRLFNAENQEAATCPICSQTMDVPVPTAEAMRRSLAQVRRNLEITAREQPRLREYIERLEGERENIRQIIRERTAAINGVLQEQEAARQLRDANLRRGRVVGRISLWLESLDMTDATTQLRDDVARLRLRVTSLEQQLDPADREARLASLLNRVGSSMTALAQELTLEHSGNPVRLDLRGVTVVVDRPERPMTLSQIGSGRNWLGYHLVTYFALHSQFRQQDRPVPGFLFLDQPTQVYYPSDQSPDLQGSLDVLSDEDRQAVFQMFNLIFNVVEALRPTFQVIVTDHADLPDTRFQSSIVERWRGGEALIPPDWQG